MKTYLLALDQGTTNSRAIIFGRDGQILGKHELPLTQHFPYPGWVEQDPDEMYANMVACSRIALKNAKISTTEIETIGLTNQRETIIMWDKISGRPIYPAIVWQDRRTHEICERISKLPIGQEIQSKTGLLIDPYFSASKILWLFEQVPGARERAEKGELIMGTVDSYLLWRLTGGKVHATDITNASRTMLFNILERRWDKPILEALGIPISILPEVFDNAANFGSVQADILGALIPITGMAGDQHAATVGQACFEEGMIKATFGTGGFLLMNTGAQVIVSKNRLLSTVAYSLNDQVTYGLEGSIFSAGETIKWLRDTLHLIETAAETEFLASSVQARQGVYLIPAFTGLGAPYWDSNARGAIMGINRTTSRAHIVMAALESVAYQTLDLVHAMTSDSGVNYRTLRVDGGMAANNWFLQFLADMLDIEVQRPTCIETTALGAAYLAGLYTNYYASTEEIAENWQLNTTFTPKMKASLREQLYSGWKEAVQRTLIQ